MLKISENPDKPFLHIVNDALNECDRLKNRWVCSEHLLLAIMKDSQTAQNPGLSALHSMNVTQLAAEKEIAERLSREGETESSGNVASHILADLFAETTGISRPRQDLQTKALFSETVISAFEKAQEYAVFLGDNEIASQHLILSLLDLPESGALKIFEELGVNLTFLRRQVFRMVARDAHRRSDLPDCKTLLCSGLVVFVDKYQSKLDALNRLCMRSALSPLSAITRSHLVHMVCLTFLSDLLCAQVTFQRYLLEETLRSLNHRVGAIDKELVATLVSTAAQNLRLNARNAIETLWCNESRLLCHMLDEAEHDLIGSIIEDLWWAESEEIAMRDLFEQAIDDHRRKHLLDLQKRRLELAQRLGKLKERLQETIKQCFSKYPIAD